ncbi:MAG: hypothetical protein QME94_12745 [Anaerolineae bacterium]|nr:hypothetical protein [Anaerolineae bacterium]
MQLVIANVVDAYRDNVALIHDPVLKEHEVLDSFYIEDRALLWHGDRKLVVTSMPVEAGHLRYLQRAMGYAQLENLAPLQPTESLCEDILREDGLRAAIVERLRGQGEAALISFVASRQVLAVAEALRRAGLAIVTPECPSAECLQVRDYLDSKAGFREFFAAVAPAMPALRMPEGAVARDVTEAARLATGFLRRGRACLCKPNNSQSGVGFLILRPGELAGDPAQWEETIRARLAADTQMISDVIVVEELIEMDHAVGGGSPSIEMRVPADPGRDVEFMYLCGQILTPSGYFFGVEMYRDLVDGGLQEKIEAAGIAVAREMRRRGYVGIFDMDMVAGVDGELYAVEVNTRRTGGTHAHEAAEHLFGPRYWERAAVISNNELAFVGEPLTWEGLRRLLSGLLWPIRGRREGVLPSIVSSLRSNRFGYVALAEDIDRARELVAAIQERLVASGRRITVLGEEKAEVAAAAVPAAAPASAA